MNPTNNHINQPIAEPHVEPKEQHAGGNANTSAPMLARTWMMFSLICLIAIAIIIKIFYLQIWPSDRAKNLGLNYTYKANDITPIRGQIFSSDGSLLATSVPEYEIRWDAKADYDVEEYRAKIDSVCQGLARIFGDRNALDYKALFKAARADGNRYQLIKAKVDYNQLQRVKQLPFVRKGAYKSGFVYIEGSRREKPFEMLAARTIGKDQADNKFGLELAFDSLLAGKKGKQLQEKIPGGYWRPMTDDFIEEPQPGADVIASIDIHLQDVANAALQRQLEKYSAAWGCAVVMEVKTGYIRAIANLGRDPETGVYLERYNYAVQESQEPGSTMKLASLMACLDEDMVALDDSIDTGNGRWKIYDMTLTDSNDEDGGNGVLTLEQVFERSSNIGTAKVIKSCFEKKPQQFLDKLHSFGLGSKLDLQLHGEASPQIYRSVKDQGWSGLSLTQMSIGYETKMTPLQILAFYNAVANNGRYMKPLFVEKIKRNGRTIEEFEPVVLRENFCKKETLAACRKMMEGVTEDDGTAEGAFKDCAYKVAGKTGTAKIHENGQYDYNRHRASFVGYFPAHDPQYSCIVVIHDPKGGNYYGGTIAAPVFSELAVKIYSTQMEYHTADFLPDTTSHAQVHIPISKDGAYEQLKQVLRGLQLPEQMAATSAWVNTKSQGTYVEISDRAIRPELVPNVVGMGLQDALYLLESQGMKVRVQGKGTVVRQSVAPGSAIKNNPLILIELK
jgi:cell division protein FtsI (penicillin-binding protein 3)